MIVSFFIFNLLINLLIRFVVNMFKLSLLAPACVLAIGILVGYDGVAVTTSSPEMTFHQGMVTL